MGMRHGDWIETYSGAQFWPMDPRANEILLIDMVHPISREGRFGNHTETLWTVGQHSLLCYHLGLYLGYKSPYLRFLFLTHDLAEGYMRDIPKPLKRSFPEYEEAELYLLNMIWADHFGIRLPNKHELHALQLVDKIALYYEAIQLKVNKNDWVPVSFTMADDIKKHDWARIEEQHPVATKLQLLSTIQEAWDAVKNVQG